MKSKVDEGLKAKIVRVAKERGFQYDEMFINKTCNLQELSDVRHSVMLLGPADAQRLPSGKLFRELTTLCPSIPALRRLGCDELYGYMTRPRIGKMVCCVSLREE